MFPNADVAPASEKLLFEVEVYDIANESHQQGGKFWTRYAGGGDW